MTTTQTEKLPSAEPLTVRLHRAPGVVALAKKTSGGLVMAKTYANLKQAYKSAANLGEGWDVYGRYPFFVGRKA